MENDPTRRSDTPSCACCWRGGSSSIPPGWQPTPAFGRVAGLDILVTIARVEVWFGLAVWVLTLAVMLQSAFGRSSRRRR